MLEKVREHIKPLACNPVQAYFTSDFQLYHLLEFILDETGPGDLILATFSVSEEFVRKLLQMKNNGLISSLAMIADHRTAVKALRLSLFTKNIAEELHLGNNHAKVVLLKNKHWNVSVVTSQNQTRGNRIECGMVCTMPEIYTSLLKSVLQERQNMIDANEIFGGAIENY
ncbi:hypothetical protein [Mangrovibacterium sp.]|uniref:hypothetical protein n=1 Tax=Mangrovibacterium sp. TaxID=1961364 RepID=UPI003565BBB4